MDPVPGSGNEEGAVDRVFRAFVEEANSYRKSLYVFPGRLKQRQGIDFDNLDRQDCTKNYFKGNSSIPCFTGVQCSCVHPKLLGLDIINQCESTSAAI